MHNVDAWWNDPESIAVDAPAPINPRPPFLDTRKAAARVELVARRALNDERAARAGLEWYTDARRFVCGIARLRGLEPTAVAGAIAALSPLISWNAQVFWMPVILDTWASGEPMPGPGFATNKRKAARILDGAPALDVLGGLKVRAFYRAIVSAGTDSTAICIDRHAWAIAHGLDWTGPKGGAYAPRLTAKRYREAVAAYIAATTSLRVAFPTLAHVLTAPRVQSLTWIYWRDNPSARF